MTIALACTWAPRDELPRWLRLRAELTRAYADTAVVVPHNADREQVRAFEAALGANAIIEPRPYWARFASLQAAVALGASHVHAADGDRLLRWMETRPDEWRIAMARLEASEFLIIGRSTAAFATHPQAMQQTEAIINAVGARLLGLPVDLGGGMRGLSRRAAELVLANALPGQYGDAEWPILAQRAGLRVEYVAVDGLDWETADHHQAAAADAAAQQRLAAAYDQRADRWAMRVRTAADIIAEAFAAERRPHSKPPA